MRSVSSVCIESPSVSNFCPGKILVEQFLEPMGISQNKLAMSIQVPAHRINEIAHGRRSITADTALRLSRFFGNSVEFWINLQSNYDIRKARQKLAKVLPLIHQVIYETASAQV